MKDPEAIFVTFNISLLSFWLNPTILPPITSYKPIYSRPSGKLSTKLILLVIVTSPVLTTVKLYFIISPIIGFKLFTVLLGITVLIVWLTV